MIKIKEGRICPDCKGMLSRKVSYSFRGIKTVYVGETVMLAGLLLPNMQHNLLTSTVGLLICIAGFLMYYRDTKHKSIIYECSKCGAQFKDN